MSKLNELKHQHNQKKNDEENENQAFQQFLKEKEQASYIDNEARKYRHPINYAKFKKHQYSKYAIKHRKEIESVSGLSRKQGFEMLKSLYDDWSPLKKAIAILILIIIIFCIFISYRNAVEGIAM